MENTPRIAKGSDEHMDRVRKNILNYCKNKRKNKGNVSSVMEDCEVIYLSMGYEPDADQEPETTGDVDVG